MAVAGMLRQYTLWVHYMGFEVNYVYSLKVVGAFLVDLLVAA